MTAGRQPHLYTMPQVGDIASGIYTTSIKFVAIINQSRSAKPFALF